MSRLLVADPGRFRLGSARPGVANATIEQTNPIAAPAAPAAPADEVSPGRRLPLPSSPLDLVYELSTNPRRYILTRQDSDPVEWLSITGMPGRLRTILEKLKTRAAYVDRLGAERTPGLNPMVVCCVTWGLPLVSQIPEVSAYLAVRDRFDRIPNDGSAEEEFVASYLRATMKVPFEANVDNRVNVQLAEGLKTGLSVLAERVSISASSMGVIAIMCALAGQSSEYVSGRTQAFVRQALADFAAMLKLKTIGAEALVDAIWS